MKTFKLILSLIAIGVWILVLQNTGIIPITHRVRVIPYFHMDICFLWIIGNNANTFQIEYAITETIPLMV